MPKPRIHPVVHPVVLVLPNGTKIRTVSVLGTANAEKSISLDISIDGHPAWRGGTGSVVNQRAGRIESFNKRFSAFGAMFSPAASNNETDADAQAS